VTPALRLDRLRGVASRAGVDAIAIIPGSTFLYVTGAQFHLMERPTVLIVPVEGRPAIVLPDLEFQSWQALGIDAEICRWKDEEGFAGAFAAAARAVSAQRLGVEGFAMRYAEFSALETAFPAATFANVQQHTNAMRAIKEADELGRLREAVHYAEAAFNQTLAQVRVGMTELEVQRRMMQAFLEQPVVGPIGAPLVLAGPNSALPHGHSGDYAIQPGDALLFDFGVTHHGYSSDITRTVFVGGVADEDRALYDVVLAANALGRDTARPGLTAHALDDAVRGHLEASPYADFVVHKTGHGLGLDVHEAPQIMRGNHTPLAPGHYFTIEPGLYRPGRVGVRIEDDVLITDKGCESFSTLPRELLVVG